MMDLIFNNITENISECNIKGFLRIVSTHSYSDTEIEKIF